VTRVIVYAVGSSYAEEAREILLRLGWDVAAWVRNRPGDVAEALQPLRDAEDLSDAELRAHPVVVPLVTPGHRRAVVDELTARGVTEHAVVVDPTTPVASSAELAAGCLVNAAGVIGAGTLLGPHVSLNRSASVGHHCELDDYATLGPGAMLCGFVHVGRGAFVSAGAIVTPQVRIGPNAVVGAGAVVTTDVPANTLVYGSPARVVRETAGYGEVGV
jgi:sugar O-acyltransferase (sialic acid O-acetyltransferase NeuD family)